VSEASTELTELFRDEATQRLNQMDAALLAVESGEQDAESVGSLFRHAHTIKGAAAMLGFDDIAALAHAAEDVLAVVRDTGAFPEDLATLLLRVTGALRAMVGGAAEPIGELVSDLAASRAKLPAGRAAAGEAPAPDAPGEVPAPDAPGEAPAPDAPEVPVPDAPEVPVPQPRAPHDTGARQGLRVPADKLDHLLNVTAEIMEYRSRLTHELGKARLLSESVSDTLGSGGRLLAELRETAFGMRMLPLSMITGPLPRAVRDIARSTGKEVDFVVAGEDTELDRVVLESLAEPLTHLLRNAVVHGIESPAERERAGKPARGRVELHAVPRGSMAEIVVADDGRGVSREALEAAGPEGSLTSVLTEPGYSTAGEVTDLAGRGVGLDAVKAYVNGLGGALHIKSEPGHGMSVVLLLPLGLALTQVLLFERGGDVYGLPLAAVEEVVQVTRTVTLQGQPAVEVRGRSLPVADIAAILGTSAPPLPDPPPAIVVSSGGRHAVATCDALLGAEEVVVKPLGPALAHLAGYIGAAILGDGRIVLLVAAATLTREATPATETPEPQAAPETPAAPKILVVEDAFTVRELQRSILEAAGYPIVTARNGRDALSVLDRDSQIALVVTDIEMPELDGIALTRAIRANAARSSLPVVIVTSRGSEDDMRRGIEAGADAYMTKSGFDQQTLLATVERLVGR
jgi:two-component system, chemotaxis family, sensor kinase CheA